MKIWKFIIRSHEWRALLSNPSLSYRGCVAAALAETEEGARAHLQRYAAENGTDARWLEVATVIELPLIEGAVICWALV